MQNTLIVLADIHYKFGLISYDELNERARIARWLSDELEGTGADPRIGSEEYLFLNEKVESEYSDSNESIITKIDNRKTNQKQNDENWLEFLCLGKWVFTKSDFDSYPSVPHGHFKSQNIKWPKLNPYTGRVFISKHQENKNQMLTKKQMKVIWSDEKFKSFCREMIVWYQEQFPYYEFPVRWPLRLPKI